MGHFSACWGSGTMGIPLFQSHFLLGEVVTESSAGIETGTTLDTGVLLQRLMPKALNVSSLSFWQNTTVLQCGPNAAISGSICSFICLKNNLLDVLVAGICGPPYLLVTCCPVW